MQMSDYLGLRRALRKHARTTSNAPQGGSNGPGTIASVAGFIDQAPSAPSLVAPVNKSVSSRNLMNLPTEILAMIIRLLIPKVVEFQRKRWMCVTKQQVIFSFTGYTSLVLVNKAFHQEARRAFLSEPHFVTESMDAALLFCKLAGDDISFLRHLSVGEAWIHEALYLALAKHLANAHTLVTLFINRGIRGPGPSSGTVDPHVVRPEEFFKDIAPLVLARQSKSEQKRLLTILKDGKCVHCCIIYSTGISPAMSQITGSERRRLEEWDFKYESCKCLKHTLKDKQVWETMEKALARRARICNDL
ncbi:hypothetical protein KVT40_008010 [Elsinoe batatas]|uniref:F-box domain-containing protein n=1 Tax=Elsinoe batatas TaxID=2601811 RepID=A0A8K0KUK6_9PEZI|nr:hypothetical protein KVT40_008010 [Elsinoe batatas]